MLLRLACLCFMIVSHLSLIPGHVCAASRLNALPIRELIDALGDHPKEDLFRIELDRIKSQYSLNLEQAAALILIAKARNYPFARGVSLTQTLVTHSLNQTANEMGREWVSDQTPYVQAFIQSIRQNTGPVLDVGCAFGYNSIAALKAGAQHVIAVDPDPRHLAVLIRETPREFLGRLDVLLGNFPEAMDLNGESFDTILLGMVLHFMTPDQVKKSLVLSYAALNPGGKLIVAVNSIYGMHFKNKISILEESVAKGRLEAQKRERFVFPTYCPETRNLMCHPFDYEIMKCNLEITGFQVIDGCEFSIGYASNGELQIIKAVASSQNSIQHTYLMMVAEKR